MVKKISIVIIVGILLFAVLSMGCINSPKESSGAITTPVPSGIVTQTAAVTTVVTTASTPVPTTKPTVTQTPFAAKLPTPAPTIASTSNIVKDKDPGAVLHLQGTSVHQEEDRTYTESSTVKNLGEVPVKAIVTLSYKKDGKTYSQDFNVEIDKTITLPFPGKIGAEDFKVEMSYRLI